MQQLFSGQLRFKDEKGKDFPEWEEKRLGELAEIKRGASSQYLNYVNSKEKGIRLIRIGDFLGGDPVYIKDTEDIKRFRIVEGDILIAGTGATAGITFIITKEFNGLAYSYNAPRIRVSEGNTKFIINYLKSDLIIRQQLRLFTGNAQPFLDTKAIKNFKLFIPVLKEQNKIAGFLNNLDQKIEQTTTQITQTQTFKKGLLQKLFV